MNKVKLKDIAQVKMGQSPDSRYYNSEEQGIPFLQGCAQFGEIYPSTSVYCSLPSKIAPKGSILFSVRAPVGDINIADCDYCIGRGLAAITPKKINNEFLYYLLVFEKYQLIKIAQGSTFESINSTELENWLLPDLGSIPEQQQIAKILDTVDKAIAQTETLIAKYKRVKTGLMQDLLTRGIDEHGQLRDPSTHKFKRSPLGMIPDEWETLTFEEITPSNAPICYGIVQPGSYANFGVPVIAIHNLNTDYYKNIHRSSKSIENRYIRSRVREGDVLISVKGTIGQVDIVPSGFVGNISRDVARIRPKSFILPGYIRQTLISKNFQIYLQKAVVGTTRAEISIGILKGLKINIPSNPKEQKYITAILDKHDHQIRIEQAYLNKLQLQKIGLMQDLLTGKTSVKPLLTNQP